MKGKVPRARRVSCHLVNAGERSDTWNSVNFESALNHSNAPARFLHQPLASPLSPLHHESCAIPNFRGWTNVRDTDIEGAPVELRPWIGQKHSAKLKNMAAAQCPIRWHETTLLISFLPFAEVQPCGTIGWIIPGENPGHFRPARTFSRAKWHAGCLESRLALLALSSSTPPFFFPGFSRRKSSLAILPH